MRNGGVEMRKTHEQRAREGETLFLRGQQLAPPGYARITIVEYNPVYDPDGTMLAPNRTESWVDVPVEWLPPPGGLYRP